MMIHGCVAVRFSALWHTISRSWFVFQVLREHRLQYCIFTKHMKVSLFYFSALCCNVQIDVAHS